MKLKSHPLSRSLTELLFPKFNMKFSNCKTSTIPIPTPHWATGKQSSIMSPQPKWTCGISTHKSFLVFNKNYFTKEGYTHFCPHFYCLIHKMSSSIRAVRIWQVFSWTIFRPEFGNHHSFYWEAVIRFCRKSIKSFSMESSYYFAVCHPV